MLMFLTINDLGKFEDYLYFSSDADKYINRLNQEEKRHFNEKRINLSVYIARLRKAQIEIVTTKLEQASKDLQDGIENIKQQIASLESLATTLNTFSQLISVVSGIVSSLI